jgi:hypothetical protein
VRCCAHRPAACLPTVLQGANIKDTDWTDVVLRKDQQVRPAVLVGCDMQGGAAEAGQHASGGVRLCWVFGCEAQPHAAKRHAVLGCAAQRVWA